MATKAEMEARIAELEALVAGAPAVAERAGAEGDVLVRNDTPQELLVDIGGKRVTFPPGEKVIERAEWEWFAKHDDAKVVTAFRSLFDSRRLSARGVL